MRFLIVRFSSIGDIVLTTPVIRCLKKQVPDAEIHYLTKKNYAAVLKGNPYLTRVHTLADDAELTFAELRDLQFDHIIDLHHNLRTLRLKKALKVPSTAFHKLNVQKWILTAFKVNLLPRVHIVDRYLETLKQWKVVNDHAGLDYFIPENDRVKESDIPASHLAGYIGIIIGATYNTKKLPVDRLKQLCAAIDHPVILIGGHEDRAKGEEISMVDRHKVYNACGKFSINESADLVRRSKFVISHDTGLMHIATALKKQVISVWGNTVPSFGMYPYYGERYIENFDTTGAGNKPFDIVEVKGLYCRPCSKIGYQKCPLGHFKCMNNIPVAAIESLVNRRLNRG